MLVFPPFRINNQVHLGHDDLVLDKEMLSEVVDLVGQVEELQAGQAHRGTAPFGRVADYGHGA